MKIKLFCLLILVLAFAGNLSAQEVQKNSQNGLAVNLNAQNTAVSDIVPPELENYMSKCADKVQQNWKKSNIKHDAVDIKITFEALNDGTVKDLKILVPSKYEQNNEAALKAIKDAEPFDKIPESLGAQSAKHTMIFPCRRYAQLSPFN